MAKDFNDYIAMMNREEVAAEWDELARFILAKYEEEHPDNDAMGEFGNTIIQEKIVFFIQKYHEWVSQ